MFGTSAHSGASTAKKLKLEDNEAASEDEEIDDAEHDEQKADEGGSVWDDASDDDGAWAVEDACGACDTDCLACCLRGSGSAILPQYFK